MVVLVYPGAFNYGGVGVFNFTNLVIRRVPVCPSSEKVVFQCLNFTETMFNNLYLLNVTNLAIDGIEFSRCGPQSPGAAINNTINAVITNCEFRYNKYAKCMYLAS